MKSVKARTKKIWVILCSLVVLYYNIVAGLTEGSPGDVEPAVAGQELVGEGVGLQEGDQTLKLGGVLGADVGCAALKVLGSLDATNERVDLNVAEAAVYNDGTAEGLTGWFQQVAAAIGHVGNLLGGGIVLRVLFPIAELCQ